MAVTRKLKGTPSTTPLPMKSQIGEFRNVGDNGGREAGKTDRNRTEDDQRHQRRKKGTQPQIADQDAVDGAANDADRHAGEECEPNAQAHTFMQIDAVSTARPKTEPTDRSMPPESITIVSPSTTRPVSANWRLRSVMFEDRKKSGKNAAEHDKDDDQRQERDGIVDPALGQQFADHVIGDEACSGDGLRRRGYSRWQRSRAVWCCSSRIRELLPRAEGARQRRLRSLQVVDRPAVARVDGVLVDPGDRAEKEHLVARRPCPCFPGARQICWAATSPWMSAYCS